MLDSAEPANKIELPTDKDWYFHKTGYRFKASDPLPVSRPWFLRKYPRGQHNSRRMLAAVKNRG